MPSYWILKTEPQTYSIDDLKKDKKTNWNNIRNFQARNFIRSMNLGDIACIYHSGDQRCAVGLAEIISKPYPDFDDTKTGDWLQVDIKYLETFKNHIPLSIFKSDAKLKDIALVKQSRLSVVPIKKGVFDYIKELSSEF